ncbi:hypothetical protein PsorP6_004310 [Peronosclerospora sorghi]|uniref:Uncharacterized protein n=1 Tax=Peronosclerospora sorghi TaxID=230839 RepID=A0ACC0VNW1_9STRA|nr:hypothetical protein PsorP6_004310 [Peronosclerospora sorghi]
MRKCVMVRYLASEAMIEKNTKNNNKKNFVVNTEHSKVANTSLDRLQTLLELIRNELEYDRARVQRHVQSKLQNFVSFIASLFEVAVLAAMNGAQSFLLHKWFSGRGYLSKRQWAFDVNSGTITRGVSCTLTDGTLDCWLLVHLKL